jgi:hypothetical protein
MEMLQKKELKSFVLSAKAEKIAKSISEWKGKEDLKIILAKDIE